MVGLFFVSFYSKNLRANYESLQIDSALSALESIANMPELAYTGEGCSGLCLDEDKLYVFASHSEEYSSFWPVAYIKVRKIYPTSSEQIVCPAENCTIYTIFESNQKNVIGRDIFVSICKRTVSFGRAYTDCSIGKLDVGVKLKS